MSHVYEITVYDRNWKLIHKDYHRFDDRQQAELRAEADSDWLGGSHYEVRIVR